MEDAGSYKEKELLVPKTETEGKRARKREREKGRKWGLAEFWLKEIWYFEDRKLVDKKKYKVKGRGGGLVVSVLTFYSDDPSSNPADY